MFNFKKENSTILFDCKDKEVYSIIGEKIKYFYTVNYEFRKAYNMDKTYNLSTVWILIGQKDREKKLLQVGRNKSADHMLSGDIGVDARYIIEGGVKNTLSWTMIFCHSTR